jgi:magnesium transporter
MLTVLVQRGDVTERAKAVDPAWLKAGATEIFWADIEMPGEADQRFLADVMHFHELSVEDALAQTHHPKIEAYENYLYVILHGIQPAGKRGFDTADIDFFIGQNYLVTIRHAPSRSVQEQLEVCARHGHVLAQGSASLFQRIVDRMVDHYRPEIDKIEDRIEAIERKIFEDPKRNPLKEILLIKRDIALLRRVALPQRDAVGRLARREFPQIPDALAYRFRDIHDHLVQITDEALFFQDRVTGLLDAHLSSQSNRLNQVMKVLTLIATIFMPPTVLASMFGMNVTLPVFPGGGGAQFWWVLSIIVGMSAGMIWLFRRQDWL